MKEKLTREKFEQIKKLMNKALMASNKKETEKYIKEIHLIRYSLSGDAKIILGELEAYIKEASGQARNKTHWESCAKQSLYKLEWKVEEMK